MRPLVASASFALLVACGGSDSAGPSPGTAIVTLPGGGAGGAAAGAGGSQSAGGAGAGGAIAGSGGHAGSAAGHGGAAGAANGGTSGGPAFTCTPMPASSPVLAATMLFDPKAPVAGDTITVLVKSVNGIDQNHAPTMTMHATTASGGTDRDTTITAGVLDAKGVVYHYEIPNVPEGDVCLLGSIDGKPEISGKITVAPRPKAPPSPSGVYKATKNHQFTCDEQVPWGNEFHVAVLDAAGNGVPGAVVDVHLPDTTDTSHIKNADTHPVPTTLTMDGTGRYDDYFWWPSNTNGFCVLELSVHGAASDVATEITSGWWESDASGCRYCDPSQPINVYGHWSHRIEFQLDASATSACVVPSDHAGQSACGPPGHLYHDPSYQVCWSIGG